MNFTVFIVLILLCQNLFANNRSDTSCGDFLGAPRDSKIERIVNDMYVDGSIKTIFKDLDMTGLCTIYCSLNILEVYRRFHGFATPTLIERSLEAKELHSVFVTASKKLLDYKGFKTPEVFGMLNFLLINYGLSDRMKLTYEPNLKENELFIANGESLLLFTLSLKYKKTRGHAIYVYKIQGDNLWAIDPNKEDLRKFEIRKNEDGSVILMDVLDPESDSGTLEIVEGIRISPEVPILNPAISESELRSEYYNNIQITLNNLVLLRLLISDRSELISNRIINNPKETLDGLFKTYFTALAARNQMELSAISFPDSGLAFQVALHVTDIEEALRESDFMSWVKKHHLVDGITEEIVIPDFSSQLIAEQLENEVSDQIKSKKAELIKAAQKYLNKDSYNDSEIIYDLQNLINGYTELAVKSGLSSEAVHRFLDEYFDILDAIMKKDFIKVKLVTNKSAASLMIYEWNMILKERRENSENY
ncbi:MAG: hypothetical protein H6625_07460 [Bdellovibrionaceae bacterium]|nr:hypothetical protein [Pseudobdellovibrionaceae bacterium]